jgi:hypothetical protein
MLPIIYIALGLGLMGHAAQGAHTEHLRRKKWQKQVTNAVSSAVSCFPTEISTLIVSYLPPYLTEATPLEQVTPLAFWARDKYGQYDKQDPQKPFVFFSEDEHNMLWITEYCYDTQSKQPSYLIPPYVIQRIYRVIQQAQGNTKDSDQDSDDERDQKSGECDHCYITDKGTREADPYMLMRIISTPHSFVGERDKQYDQATKQTRFFLGPDYTINQFAQNLKSLAKAPSNIDSLPGYRQEYYNSLKSYRSTYQKTGAHVVGLLSEVGHSQSKAIFLSE